MPDPLTVIVIAVILLVAFGGDDAEAPAEVEPDPYRDGLEAASRISAMAWEAEALMHREALRVLDEKEETR